MKTKDSVTIEDMRELRARTAQWDRWKGSMMMLSIVIMTGRTSLHPDSDVALSILMELVEIAVSPLLVAAGLTARSNRVPVLYKFVTAINRVAAQGKLDRMMNLLGGRLLDMLGKDNPVLEEAKRCAQAEAAEGVWSLYEIVRPLVNDTFSSVSDMEAISIMMADSDGYGFNYTPESVAESACDYFMHDVSDMTDVERRESDYPFDDKAPDVPARDVLNMAWERGAREREAYQYRSHVIFSHGIRSIADMAAIALADRSLSKATANDIEAYCRDGAYFGNVWSWLSLFHEDNDDDGELHDLYMECWFVLRGRLEKAIESKLDQREATGTECTDDEV